LAPTHVAEPESPTEDTPKSSLDILHGPKLNPPAETPIINTGMTSNYTPIAAHTSKPAHTVARTEPVKNVIAELKTTKGVLLNLVLIKDGQPKKAQSALNEFSQRCCTAGTPIDMINYECKPVVKDQCTGSFEVCVLQGDTCIVKATGHTKKEALQFAALAAIKYLAPVEYEYYISALNLPENVKAAVTPASDGALVVKQPPKPGTVKLLTARNQN